MPAPITAMVLLSLIAGQRFAEKIVDRGKRPLPNGINLPENLVAGLLAQRH
jgi:hypothetical protein